MGAIAYEDIVTPTMSCSYPYTEWQLPLAALGNLLVFADIWILKLILPSFKYRHN